MKIIGVYDNNITCKMREKPLRIQYTFNNVELTLISVITRVKFWLFTMHNTLSQAQAAGQPLTPSDAYSQSRSSFIPTVSFLLVSRSEDMSKENTNATPGYKKK